VRGEKATEDKPQQKNEKAINRSHMNSSFKVVSVDSKKDTYSDPIDVEEEAPYRTVRGNQPVYIHPSSVLFGRVHRHEEQVRKQSQFGNRMKISSDGLPPFVVFAELLITTKQVKLLLLNTIIITVH